MYMHNQNYVLKPNVRKYIISDGNQSSTREPEARDHRRYNETLEVSHTNKKTTTRHNAAQAREKVVTT